MLSRRQVARTTVWAELTLGVTFWIPVARALAVLELTALAETTLGSTALAQTAAKLMAQATL